MDKQIYKEKLICYQSQTLNIDVLKDMSEVNIKGKTLMFLPTIILHHSGFF